MADARITTEDLAEELGATPQAIYESRRRKEYPGKLGHRQGRRLIFHRSEVNDWLESVPQQITDGTGVVLRWMTDPAYGEGETTENATQAILWALNGIHTTLRAIHNELRAQRPTYLPAELITMNVTGGEEE